MPIARTTRHCRANRVSIVPSSRHVAYVPCDFFARRVATTTNRRRSGHVDYDNRRRRRLRRNSSSAWWRASSRLCKCASSPIKSVLFAAVEVTPLLAPPYGREDGMAAATKGIVRRSISFAIFPPYTGCVFPVCLLSVCRASLREKGVRYLPQRAK